MSTNAEKAYASFHADLGKEEGVGEWFVVDQARINQFADVTIDHQFIHVDPEAAKGTPFGTTIAHGFLTLSMLGPISQQLVVIEDAATSINYGLNKVRFPSAMPVGAEFRGHGEVVDVTQIDGGVQLTAAFTIEVKGAGRPAVVAECLFRYYR